MELNTPSTRMAIRKDAPMVTWMNRARRKAARKPKIAVGKMMRPAFVVPASASGNSRIADIIMPKAISVTVCPRRRSSSSWLGTVSSHWILERMISFLVREYKHHRDIHCKLDCRKKELHFQTGIRPFSDTRSLEHNVEHIFRFIPNSD